MTPIHDTPASTPAGGRRRRARTLAPLPVLAAAGLLSACGGGAGTPAATHTPKPTAEATDTPDDSSPTPVANDVSAGSIVFSSSLKTGTTDFGTSGTNVSQDGSGITLDVVKAGGGYTYSTPKDFHGIPDSMAVRVKIDEQQTSGVYAGIACRGLDDKNTYLLLVDAKGDYAVVRVKAGDQTVLKKGEAAFTVTWPITLDVACVTPSSDDTMNRLVLVANGTKLASIDDSFNEVAISNSFALFAISPAADTGTGAVTFHDLSVRSASSE